MTTNQEITEQDARRIKAYLQAGKHYPPSLASIQRVVEAALDLEIVREKV